MASKALARRREKPNLVPFAYLKSNDGKRFVEVRWVEGGVATVHDLTDSDETSTFEITTPEIGAWTQVIPAKDED